MTGGWSAGIRANLDQPAELMQQNLGMSLTVIEEARRAGVSRLVYVGSSCCYPRDCRQPMSETELFGGPLEPSSAPYATAKLAGMKLVQAYRAQYAVRYISVIPGDLFGPADDFDPKTSHVVPALLRRAYESVEAGAEELVIWGTGRPVRDFVYADDAARSMVFAAERYDDDLPLNLGSGRGTSVESLALLVCAIVGFQGRLRFDSNKPDGMRMKILDSSRLEELGYRHWTPLRPALAATLDWWLERGER